MPGYGVLDRSRLDQYGQQLRDINDSDYQTQAYLIAQRQKQQALARRSAELQSYVSAVSPRTINYPATSTQTLREPDLPDNIPVDTSDRLAKMDNSDSGSLDAGIADIANRAGIKPEHLKAVMQFESGLKANAVNPTSNATGLIQFLPSTAAALGTSVDQLKSMTPQQQLQYVGKYLAPFRGKLNSLQDVAMAVFNPASIGKPSDTPFSDKIQAQNPGIKTIGDYTSKLPSTSPMNVAQLVSAKQAFPVDTQTTPARTETIMPSDAEQQAAFTKTFANLLGQGTPEGDEAAKYLVQLHSARQPQLSELGAYLRGMDISGFEKMKHSPHGGQLVGVTEKGNFPIYFHPDTNTTTVDSPTGEDDYTNNKDKYGAMLGKNFKTQEDIAKTRGASYAASKVVNVYDSQARANKVMTVADYINKSGKEPDRYFSTVGQKDTFQRATLLGDIYGTISNTSDSLDKLEATNKEFSQGLRAQLALALKNPNPDEAISNVLTAEFRQGLSPEEQDYAQNLAQLAENAMAMRSVLGAGQGSDELREAIRATIPSASTPTIAYARGQLDKFKQTLDRLGRNVMNVPLPNGMQKGNSPATPSTGQKIKIDY
jgi:hypothetical protein